MNDDVLVINGPNLNLLGIRQPGIYGSQSLESIIQDLETKAALEGVIIRSMQSNAEFHLIDFLNSNYLELSRGCQKIAGIIINPGAFSHTSVAIRDAIEMFVEEKVPVVRGKFGLT